MIEIKRMKSEAGYSNCFELLFHLKDYIPTAFFEQHEDGAGAELYFYISLFYKFGIFDCKQEHYHQSIWSTEYDCVYNGVSFSMVYDEDYDFITFAVLPRNIKHIAMIADRIKFLVETEGMKLELKTDPHAQSSENE